MDVEQEPGLVYSETTETKFDPPGATGSEEATKVVVVRSQFEMDHGQQRQDRGIRKYCRPGFTRNLHDNVREGIAVSAVCCEWMTLLAFSLLATALPIALITIGAVHINDCPDIPELPILLIASGSILALGTLINLGDELMNGYLYNVEGKRKSTLLGVINTIIFLLLIICFVFGMVLVYGKPNPASGVSTWNNANATDWSDEERNATNIQYARAITKSRKPEYCHQAVFQFAFWLLNILSVLSVVIIVLAVVGYSTKLARQIPF